MQLLVVFARGTSVFLSTYTDQPVLSRILKPELALLEWKEERATCCHLCEVTASSLPLSDLVFVDACLDSLALTVRCPYEDSGCIGLAASFTELHGTYAVRR